MPTNAELCWNAGRGYDPGSGMCVARNSTKDDPDGLSYFDPQSGALTSAPFVGANQANIQWTRPAVAANAPVTVPTVYPSPFGSAAGGGITDFLTQPGLLGFPVWTNIAAGAVLLFILSQMDGGGKSKKSTGWI